MLPKLIFINGCCNSKGSIMKLQINYKRSFRIKTVEQLEAKKMLENFTYVGKKIITFCTCGRHQSQENTPSQKNIHNYLQNCLKFYDPPSLSLLMSYP